MKNKFEKELKSKAYDAVPDGWDEVEKKASVFEPRGLAENTKKSNIKSIAAAAAAVAVVIGAGFAIKAMQRSPVPYEAEESERAEASETEPGIATVNVLSDETAPEELTAQETAESEEGLFDFLGKKTEKKPESSKENKDGKKGTASSASEKKTTSKETGPDSPKTSNAAAESVRAGAPGKPDPDAATTNVKLSTTVAAETAASMNYTYSINSGKYKNYCPGKVIEKDKVGEKIEPVTVTGYWEGFGAECEGKTEKETLSADAYYIKGVSDSVAVCLKFNDKGDALTTNHYYVVINPEADYSAVNDYVIGRSVPSTAAEKETTKKNEPTTSKPYSTGIVREAELTGNKKETTQKNVPTASNPYYSEISKEAERAGNKKETVTETSKAHTVAQTIPE